jgi:glycosyltransferase involved in cell wall biosynthesis
MKLEIIDTKPVIESVAVITPTIGKDTIRQCVDSVRNQTYKNIKHYVVIDGDFNEDEIHDKITGGKMSYPQKICVLPENVGGDGWYGHRVYAAFSFLVNADAVVFLDEDNWFEPDHIESMVNLMNEKSLDWCHSFRKIYTESGEYLCDDNCESLGLVHPAWHNDEVFHVDTSSYMVRRDVAVRVGGAWYGKWGQDRQYFAVLANHFPENYCTLKHTLNYRLGGNQGSVTADFFKDGNNVMNQRYPEGLPWNPRKS